MWNIYSRVKTISSLQLSVQRSRDTFKCKITYHWKKKVADLILFDTNVFAFDWIERKSKFKRTAFGCISFINFPRNTFVFTHIHVKHLHYVHASLKLKGKNCWKILNNDVTDPMNTWRIIDVASCPMLLHSFRYRYSSSFSTEPPSHSPAASSNASSNKFNRKFHCKEKKRIKNEWNEGKNVRKLYNKHGRDRDPQTVIYTHTSEPNQQTGGRTTGIQKKLDPIW